MYRLLDASTRTLAVDGIATPVTDTITTLNPHDGHPTTITGLSHTAVSTGDPAFPSLSPAPASSLAR